MINGIMEKIYDYDFVTGDCEFDLLHDNDITRCHGKMARFQAGQPVTVEFETNEDGFSVSSIAIDFGNVTACKKLVANYEQLPHGAHEDNFENIRELDRKTVNILYAPQLEQNLYEKYGDYLGFPQIRQMVTAGMYDIPENPYEACGICGFKVADMVASQREVSALNRSRLNALVNCAMDRLAENGDTYISVESLISQINIMQSAYTKLDARFILMNTKISGRYEITGHGYAVKARVIAEETVAKQIARLSLTGKSLNFNPEMTEEIQKDAGIVYAPQQKEAFNMCASTGLKILTGGPGTGKTSTLKGILECLKKLIPGAVIKCCAPTGRAAQRMKESTGLEAQTVHRLCEYKPFAGESYSSKNETDPIAADIVVVDEVSMLDIEMASMLLSAIKDGAFVLFVGDVNQLESVGAGSVLRDMIASGQIPVYQLTKVYRQAETSAIVSNANKVNAGDMNIQEAEDFKIIRCLNENEVSEKTIELFKQFYDTENPYEFQMLSPVKAGAAGVNNLNRLAQQDIFAGKNQPHITAGKRKYFVEDKVIFLKNDTEKDFYNGDCGIIINLCEAEMTVDVMGNIISLSREDICDRVSLAYDVTIHKSQGSEYQVVVIPLMKRAPGMLNRNLLYTAITRAKKKVYVITEHDALEMCIKHVSSGRKTGLVSRILSAFV